MLMARNGECIVIIISPSIGTRRRKEGGFPGSDSILAQLRDKPALRRVGLVSHTGPPARAGAVILNEEGEEVGHVTSGCPSPCLKNNIAMGYVLRHLSKAGHRLKIKVRNKTLDTEITKMPFVQHKYYSNS